MKWEYTILKRPASTFASDLCVTDLNVLGESGWELIAVVGTEVFIFKRPLGEAFGTFSHPSAKWEAKVSSLDFTQETDERTFHYWLLQDPNSGLEKVKAAYIAGLKEGRRRT